MNLRNVASTLFLSLTLGACAHVAPTTETPVAQGPTIEEQRAREFLTTLTIKKNRFLAQQGYDANYEPITTAVAPCAQIAHSQWANNVDSATFDTFTRTMERCYGASEQG